MGAVTAKLKPVAGMCFSLDDKLHICMGSETPHLYCPDMASLRTWEEVKDRVVLVNCPSTTAGILDNVRRLAEDKFAFVLADYDIGPVTKITWKCVVKGKSFTADTEGHAVFLAFKELVDGRKEAEDA